MEKEREIELIKSRWKNLNWTPVHGGFQMTDNHFYARHIKHEKDADWPRIHYEIKKHWGLSPFAQDIEYIYYQP